MEQDLISTIESCWSDFKKWYDKRCESYIESVVNKGMSPKKAVNEPWVCWSEKDLVIHLSRLIYERTKDLDVHVEFSLKPTNFKNFPKLYKLLGGVKKKIKIAIKPDMVVCYDTHDEPLLAVIEAKMYRRQYGLEDFEKGVAKDFETLKILHELGICHSVFWMVLDDHYWFKNKEVSRQLEKKMETFWNKGIRVLYHKSTVKKKFLS